MTSSHASPRLGQSGAPQLGRGSGTHSPERHPGASLGCPMARHRRDFTKTVPALENDRHLPFSEGTSGVVTLALLVGIAIAFFLAARLGLALLTEEEVAVFWPASGIAAGILITLGHGARSPVGWAVMLASTAASFTWGRSVWSSLAIALCDTAQVFFVAWLIERWFGSAFSIGNVRHVLGCWLRQ